MDNIWTLVILALVGVLAWKMMTSSKEGYTMTVTTPNVVVNRPSCAAATIPSYATLQTTAENQLTDMVNQQKSQTISPKDLLPPTTSDMTACGANPVDLQNDLANYSAAIGVARVGVVSSSVPKRYLSLDLRGTEKIATCQNISPWNMPSVGDDIPMNAPIC
jgi:hypothetical protein